MDSHDAVEAGVGEFHPHPDWCPGCGPGLPGFDTRDVAVVALSAPRDLGAFAMLPLMGLVNSLPMKTPINLVGYGVQGFERGGGQPLEGHYCVRSVWSGSVVQARRLGM